MDFILALEESNKKNNKKYINIQNMNRNRNSENNTNANNIGECNYGYRNQNSYHNYNGLYPVLTTPFKLLYDWYNNVYARRNPGAYDIWMKMGLCNKWGHGRYRYSSFAEYKNFVMDNVETKVSFFNLFPKKYLTQEMCDEALSKNFESYVYTPNKFKTKENSQYFFKIITDTYYDEDKKCYIKNTSNQSNEKEDKYRFLVNTTFRIKLFFSDILPIFLTKEMCDYAFSQTVEVLPYIPERFLTQDMCNDAVNKKHYLGYFVPEKYETEQSLIYKKKIIKVIHLPLYSKKILPIMIGDYEDNDKLDKVKID